jgi:hypothetical protein
MSDDENEALWRLYGAQEASVAIRTTYAELVRVSTKRPACISA